MYCLETNIDYPFGYNALKHHLLFCRGYVEGFDVFQANWLEKLQSDLYCIGNNVIDIYEGEYLLSELEAELKQIMMRKGIFYREALKKVLALSDFMVISLADNSKWIIRWGQDEKRYAHLHPARKGELLFRTKGNAWKTALATVIFARKFQENVITKPSINKVRGEVLSLSPVRSVEESTEIKTCIDKLR